VLDIIYIFNINTPPDLTVYMEKKKKKNQTY